MDIIKLFQNSKDIDLYKAGDKIFEVGDAARNLFVIIEGEVEISLNGRVLNRLGPGSLLGEMGLIGNHHRTATATAHSDCRLAAVDERRFLFLVQETPFFAMHVMRVLAERIQRIEAEAGQA